MAPGGLAERTAVVESAPRRSVARSLLSVFLQEDINFLLTNRIPRRLATSLMHWFSRIELAPISRLSIAGWRYLDGELDLREAETTRFRSLNECFTRRLKVGARPIDPATDVLTSPCDAIVGACGRVRGTELIQAKGFPYTLEDLLGDPELVAAHRDGTYVTLRLKGSMYHRFHAPCAGRLTHVTYISGDTWNVNPIALKRVERLFCRNERAVLPIRTPWPDVALTLVPVAAVLVASIRLAGMETPLDLRYRGPNHIPFERSFAKGDELGWFEQGSTILVFASGPVALCNPAIPGARIKVGESLLRLCGGSAAAA